MESTTPNVPSIGVVIPAYRAEQTLEHAVGSVLAQTRSADELIVVDDGSPDRTGEVAESFGKRLRVVRQEQRGAGAARRTGVDACRSDYVAFLDADDAWPSEKLEVYENVLRSESVHLLFSDFRRADLEDDDRTRLARNRSFFPFLDSHLSRSRASSEIQNLTELSSGEATALLLRGFPAYPSTMLVRRSSLREVGGWSPEFERSQDLDLTLRMARRFGVHYLDRVLATVGLHEGNSDPRPYVVQQTRSDIGVLEAHLSDTRASKEYRASVESALAARWCGLGYQLRLGGDRAAARLAYRKAMFLPGRRLHALGRWLYLGLR